MSTVHEPSGRYGSDASDFEPEPVGSNSSGRSQGPSIGELLSQVSSDLSALVSQEIALAKAEARESATRAGRGAGMLSGAALAAWFVLLFLSVALWWGLGNEIGRGWSALVVAALWAIAALVLAVLGRAELRKTTGLPRTVQTAKEIPDALRGREETR